jgi:hypothetical protein
MNNTVKPLFDPEKDYTVLGKPPFDPNQPFELAPMLKEPEPPKPLDESEILSLIRAELAKVKPQIINRIVERVEIKEPPKEKKTFAEESTVQGLKARIEELQKKMKEVENKADNPIVVGGPGVIGIPAPETGSESDVLTVVNRKAKWKAATAGSGGLTAGTYSVSNPTTDRTFDADDTSLDELADIVGTLISDLGGL